MTQSAMMVDARESEVFIWQALQAIEALTGGQFATLDHLEQFKNVVRSHIQMTIDELRMTNDPVRKIRNPSPAIRCR